MAVSRKQLRKYFVENISGPVKVKQVARALGVKNSEYGSLRKTMRELARDGVLSRVKRNSYVLAENSDTVTGRLQMARRGFGFVIPDKGGRDLFVKNFNLSSAFDGDRVEARVIRRPREGNPEAEVVRVLNHSRRRFIGFLEKRKKFSRLDPLDEKVATDILIPTAEVSGLKNGRKILVEIFDWGGGSKKPMARLVEVLDSKDVSADRAILLKYELPQDFPKDVLAEADRMPDKVSGEEIQGRKDLRRLATMTIDPADAEDFDDALSAVRLKNGDVEVGVHIADVSHYVREGGSMDREAAERAMSVYLNDAYIPMLPKKLSSNICSLVEGEDRLAITVLMRISPDGELRRTRLARSVINSSKRFTYEEAQEILDSGRGQVKGVSDEVVETLRLLRELSIRRRKIRSDAGQIDFDLPEPLVVSGKEGEPLGIERKPRLETHRLVEEFMITANEAVARRLARSKLPGIYRIHEVPDPDLVENMNFQLRTLDSELFISPREAHNPKAFSRILDIGEERDMGELVSLVVIRSMKRALYSTENIGHFGLASECYTHFTSPIRRYPDLAVHRLLELLIRKKQPSSGMIDSLEDRLAEICSHCDMRERIIDDASRESDDILEARFMQDKVGGKYHAVITGVKPFGFSVRLDGTLVEGFVHASKLTDDYYELGAETAELVGSKHGRSYRLGDKVLLMLKSADPETMKIEFIPAELASAAVGKDGGRSGRRERK